MHKNFWKEIKKPIIALAPMDGYTDSPFRYVCKKVNPNIVVFTEFTSAEGLLYNQDKVKKKFSFQAFEQPIIAQIFGNNEKAFVEAAKLCESLGFSAIDINMGCPARNVVKSEQGVALRKNHYRAFKLIEVVAQSTPLAVSVKTRLGWDSSEDLFSFVEGVWNSGASLIIIHGRTYQDPYSSKAHFEPMYEIKKNIPIFVIGNGGIQSLDEGYKKLHNLDGFMIGRAAMGNPWIFSHKKLFTLSEKLSLIKLHAQLMYESKGSSRAMFDIRKHLIAYVRSIPHASQIRSNIAHIDTLESILGMLDTIHVEIIESS